MLKGDHSYQRRQEKTLPNNEPSSGQRDKTLSRFKKLLREKYPRVYGFFFSEPPFYIRHFFPILVTLGLIGGAAALWIPSNTGWLRQNGLSGEAEQKSISDLRLHFLYITGGIIAILTLLQTNWKNQVDRRKVEADIQKNEQDAKNEAAKREQDAVKSERDHIRQVHAERRSRYTKAIEQLANEKATVRLGGIYTLVGLVDEWLADDTLESEEQQKEGQVIINNLCSYIRSPFTLALKAEMFEGDSEPDNYEGDFSKDQAAFHEEQDVRRTVFVEMYKHSSTFTRDGFGKIIDTATGTWSDFEFDFSRAPIFYPLSSLTIEKGNFSSAKFYSNADFSEATFTQTADFSWATFTQNARFSGATFAQTADFSWAAFTQNADFIGAAFTQTARFGEATFTQTADFGEATFTQTADFSEATFTQTARFSWATFTQTANFSWATFTQTADFSWATFTQTANFNEATFTQTANFRRAFFIQTARFSEATFTQTVNFSEATFTQTVNFSEATFEKYSPRFAATAHGVSDEAYRARFAALSEKQPAHNFAVHESSRPILLGETELGNIKYNLPMGAVLFDPYSWDEEKKDYTHVSAPAK